MDLNIVGLKEAYKPNQGCIVKKQSSEEKQALRPNSRPTGLDLHQLGGVNSRQWCKKGFTGLGLICIVKLDLDSSPTPDHLSPSSNIPSKTLANAQASVALELIIDDSGVPKSMTTHQTVQLYLTVSNLMLIEYNSNCIDQISTKQI